MKDASARRAIEKVVHRLGGSINWEDVEIKEIHAVIDSDHRNDLKEVMKDQKILFDIVLKLAEELGYDLQSTDNKMKWFKRIKGIENL